MTDFAVGSQGFAMPVYARISKGVRSHLYARRSEWACAAVITWWGVSLMAPGDTFALSPTYSGLARIATEPVWGAVCLALGLFRLAALTVNGTFQGTWYSRYSPHVRAITAYLTAMVYFLIVYGVLTNLGKVPLSTGLGAYAALAFLDVSNALGTAKESGYQTREFRNAGAF